MMGCGGSKGKQEAWQYGDANYPYQQYPQQMPEISDEVLEEFLALERAIKAYEKRHLVETLQVRTDQLENLKGSLIRMEKEYSDLERQIAIGEQELRNSRNKNVKTFVMTQNDYDEDALYEGAEQLAALNKREILRKEIEGSRVHLDELKQEVASLAEDVNDLQTLYQREEDLLRSIFGGEYGSFTENQLETELDFMELQKQTIEAANFKWRQAQVMVEYAVRQMGSAVDKWTTLMRLTASQMENRYAMAEETRNNLIAATQNMEGAQRYLPNIKFPYCNEDEVAMLTQATSYVFTDMQSPERQRHALEVYNVTFRRAAALLQWFDEVVNNIILQDLIEINEKVREKANALRRERLQLIRLRFREQGRDIDLDDISFDDMDADDNEYIAQMQEQEQRQNNRDFGGLRVPSPLPKAELAPPPSKHELFGKLESLKLEYEESMGKMNYEKDVNKARMHSDLNIKLQDRRMRRARSKLHSQEVQAIQQRAQELGGQSEAALNRLTGIMEKDMRGPMNNDMRGPMNNDMRGPMNNGYPSYGR